MTVFFAGLFLGLGLIVAIGAQNAFVLRQGLRRAHVFWVCLVCAASDAVLIAVGISGLGALGRVAPWIEPVLRYGGVAFLLAYGARSFWSAWLGSSGLAAAAQKDASLWSVLGTCLALTWLNPHVYLDMVVLIGSISAQYPGRELAFGAGAATASVLFFFGLGYGARLLGPLFARPATWRMLDLAVGVVMWAIAAKLLVG